MVAAAANTISGQLAAYAAGLTYDDLPDDVRALAHMVLLDTLACGLAGSATDELRMIREAMCAAGGQGDTLLWGTAQTTSLPVAALANGAAVHVREIDDFGGCNHSGAVVIPAAVGTAARVGASGRALLTAIVAGYDVARRTMDGGGGNRQFKARGWHTTLTCGGFGAAAAVGCLLGLDAQRLQWALGYAGSNAGGTWAFIPDGAMSKRVHPGLAAQTGVVAAYLAASGVTGPTQIYEAEWGGYYPTYVGAHATPERAVDGLGSDFRIRQVGIKPYAACRGTHSGIDVILGFRRDHGIGPDDVAAVTVRCNRTHRRQLSKQEVATVLDAQFSLPYAIAVALTTGGAMLDQFTAEALLRPAIRDLARRVDLVVDDSIAEGSEPALDVRLRDGSVLHGQVAVARGDRRNPLSDEEIRAKFRTTAGQVLPQSGVAALEQAIDGIEDMRDVRDLTALLSPSAVGQQTSRRVAG